MLMKIDSAEGCYRVAVSSNKFQITNYKKIAIKSWCLKCFLKEVFQDTIKIFLQKKQEVDRQYHEGTRSRNQ